MDARANADGGSRLNPKTGLYLLIGDPVEQSLSPAIHNAAFRALGLSSIYISMRVPRPVLSRVMVGLRAMSVAGLNVTVPHKIEIIRMLDGLDDSAKLAGAVNTVKNLRGRFVGFNTDGEGALRALEERTGGLSGKRVLLLGAGGAGRAIAFALAKAGAEVSIANRTVSKARALSMDIQRRLGVRVRWLGLTRSQLTNSLRRADVLINATIIGMYPKVRETLITADMMHPGLIVNDIVYKPLETRLLREAKRAGAETVNGLGMLVHQAALSFEIWTGRHAPIKVMEAVAKGELGG